MSSFFFKPTINIEVDEVPNRRKVYLRDEDYNRIILPSFYDRENVQGSVKIQLNSNTLSHSGIKILFEGVIENTSKTLSKEDKFITLEKELLPPGKITQQVLVVPFHFNNVEKAYESYRGIVFNVIYRLKVILKTTFKQFAWEREIGVVHPKSREEMNQNNPPFRLDVKIAKMLKLSFEMDHTKYGTKDICTGRVIFKETSMKMKMMMIQIMRREAVTGGETDVAILCRYELMDGCPVNEEVVPIRFFLSPYELTPTYDNVNHKFSVKYILNLVLIDDEEKRYFKQHEIELFRIPRVYKVEGPSDNNEKKPLTNK